MGTFAETSGTFVNANGRPQSFGGIAQPVGESRPGWKILRVLGNLLELPDCAYESTADIAREIVAVASAALVGEEPPNLPDAPEPSPAVTTSIDVAELDVPMYRIDALVRRAHALQLTRDGQAGHDAADLPRQAQG
jgi:NADH-quinone oxidoreductase subunit G